MARTTLDNIRTAASEVSVNASIAYAYANGVEPRRAPQKESEIAPEGIVLELDNFVVEYSDGKYIITDQAINHMILCGFRHRFEMFEVLKRDCFFTEDIELIWLRVRVATKQTNTKSFKSLFRQKLDVYNVEFGFNL